MVQVHHALFYYCHQTLIRAVLEEREGEGARKNRWQTGKVGGRFFLFDCVELEAIKHCDTNIGGSGAPSSEEPVFCPVNKPLLSAGDSSHSGRDGAKVK